MVTNGLAGEVNFDVAAILAQGYPDNPYIFGWLLRKPQHNESGDISFASRDGVRAPRLILTTLSASGGQQVPALPPNTLPSGAVADSIYAPINYLYHPSLGGLAPRDIVFVTFNPGTTQQDRQAAIDLIGATVVGGIRIGSDGMYMVRIPQHSTIDPLLDAIATLDALPQVMFVAPHPPGTVPSYRRPRDGVPAPRLILTTQESSPSPLAFPPDSFPSQYADSPNVVQTPACSGIRFLRHIILLTFKPGTTLAQREEALTLVNGIVVGGRAVTEQHTYYIIVDDDEFGSGVCAATSNLESLAYVESASPSYEIEPFFRGPGANRRIPLGVHMGGDRNAGVEHMIGASSERDSTRVPG